MLERETVKRIYDMVFVKPRTVKELAMDIKKSWVTADRYVERLAGEEGVIGVRTFRGGTRGALKIVYWNLAKTATESIYQKELYDAIMAATKKKQFSPFDVYQFVDKNKKEVKIASSPDKTTPWKGLPDLLMSATESIYVFSGNMSWTNASVKGRDMTDILYDIAKRKIQIKIVTRVDLATYDTFAKVDAINKRLGYDAIEIRHREQPLRGFVIDNKTAIFRERKHPEDYRPGELKQASHIYYNIKDEKWIDWFNKIFWDMFRSGVDGRSRMKELDDII
jgi:hypothetical protein